jgi:ABC-type cobalamin transport system ATPase subunit
VLTSHDPARGLAEADLVLGLRGGRVGLLGAAQDVETEAVAELYR